MSNDNKVRFYFYKNQSKQSGVEYLGASFEKMKPEDKAELCRIINAGGRVNIYRNEKKEEDWQADYNASAYMPDQQKQAPAPQHHTDQGSVF